MSNYYFLFSFIFTLFIITKQQQNNENLVFVPIITSKNTAEYINLIKMLRRPTPLNSADSQMYNYKIQNGQDGRTKRQLAAAFNEGSILTPENRIQREFTEKRFSRIGGNIMMG
ncbi:unnamed protein product [Meloidogyne enterolobii]|uniref:Uncharacterized protein n=1 Tax=Meloidogyne enterolobii TaxID=390850 RepID=A0ACB0XV48_MELEN